MPRINSANPDFGLLDVPSDKPNYSHGLEKRRSYIPVAFQITSPFDNKRVLLPHALVMHINPQTWSETHNKKVERIQTRGGWVEQHWGDDLTEISADGTTGAFMNIYTGLTSVLRHRTIAWDRYRDLHDLYRNNGSLYDPFGNIVLQGNVMLMYDRGTYIGYFNKFDVEETDDQPFAFKMSWTFKVQEELMKIPGLTKDPSQRGKVSPAFQSQNQTQARFNSPPQTLEEIEDVENASLRVEAEGQAAKAAASVKASGKPVTPTRSAAPTVEAARPAAPKVTIPTTAGAPNPNAAPVALPPIAPADRPLSAAETAEARRLGIIQ